MLLSVIIQIILGGLIAGLGYFFSDRLLSRFSLFNVPHLLSALVGFVLGAIGIFLLPVISSRLANWFRGLVSSLLKDTLTELWERQSRLVERTLHSGSRAGSLLKRGHSPNIGSGAPLDRGSHKGNVLLDTSAIIDGRISDIAAVGFLPGKVVVPRFVLEELQRVADSADDLRRGRGRRGLKMLEDLRKMKGREFSILEVVGASGDVDQRLISLALELGASLVTVDFNLNKAAKVSGVTVLNINELANALKTALIPGEAVTIKITHEGKESNQGVGYLEDGTMIVVENGRDRVGLETRVEVTRVLQTEAGKLVFAKAT